MGEIHSASCRRLIEDFPHERLHNIYARVALDFYRGKVTNWKKKRLRAKTESRCKTISQIRNSFIINFQSRLTMNSHLPIRKSIVPSSTFFEEFHRITTNPSYAIYLQTHAVRRPKIK